MDAAIGLEGALDDQKEFWFGAFVGYTHLFQTANMEGNQLLNTNDVNILQMGLSLSFDPVKPKVVEHVVERERVVVHTVKVEVPARMAERAPARLEQVETVYFDWDSNRLRWESNDKLDRMIKLFAAHPNARITVQGHASKDGNYDHNVALSDRRTAAVVAYLTAHGVKSDRLVSEHFGPRSRAITSRKRARSAIGASSSRCRSPSTRPSSGLCSPAKYRGATSSARKVS
jgi:outer membrane protein OmpA-like peptidoglycan-associated protein